MENEVQATNLEFLGKRSPKKKRAASPADGSFHANHSADNRYVVSVKHEGSALRAAAFHLLSQAKKSGKKRARGKAFPSQKM